MAFEFTAVDLVEVTTIVTVGCLFYLLLWWASGEDLKVK